MKLLGQKSYRRMILFRELLPFQVTPGSLERPLLWNFQWDGVPFLWILRENVILKQFYFRQIFDLLNYCVKNEKKMLNSPFFSNQCQELSL